VANLETQAFLERMVPLGFVAVAVVVVVAVVVAVVEPWACVPVVAGRPYDTLGKSADAGTMSGGSLCGRCDYTAASYILVPSPRGR
jgi:hypothetical protein